MSDKSDKKECTFSEHQYEDDTFHTWHIDGLAQCGSDRYSRNHDPNIYSESFKILYEQEQKEGSDKFVRIYGQDEEPVKSQQDIEDDEFHPFKTGIAKFDAMLSGKREQIGVQSKNILDQTQTNINESNIISKTTQQGDNIEKEATFIQNNFESVNVDSVVNNSTADSNNIDDASSSVVISNAYTEKERMQIFEDAYKQGFAEGTTKGHEEGLARGIEEGFQAGHEKGLQDGYEQGFQKGEEEGYDAGFQKGEEDGKVVGDARALEIITSLEDILQKSEQSWSNAIKTHEVKILSMICKITEKIVFAKLELDEGIVKESILNALATMPEPEEIVLNISPDDYEYVEMVKDDFFTNIKSLKSISVIANPSVQRGGCKIESSKGKVETDIKTRLEQVFTSVMGARVS
ncbi:MAG: hypothetical protein HQK72_00930 [Desulfamplus sp.]|nr:hypothetical protein [Desulfamplus sp.]